MGSPGETVLYMGFRPHDWWRYCQQPRFLIPPAELYVLHSFELYRAVAPLARRLALVFITRLMISIAVSKPLNGSLRLTVSAADIN